MAFLDLKCLLRLRCVSTGFRSEAITRYGLEEFCSTFPPRTLSMEQDGLLRAEFVDPRCASGFDTLDATARFEALVAYRSRILAFLRAPMDDDGSAI